MTKNIGRKRRLYILKYLLTGEIYLQPKLLTLLNNNKEFENDEITNATLSGVLGNLYKQSIIDKYPIKQEGKGANPNAIIINNNHETLVKLISEFYSSDIGVLANSFKHYLIHSDYAQKLINQDLILKIESNINEIIQETIPVKDFKFTNIETDIILNILQSSPSALYYATINYEVIDKILKDLKILKIGCDDDSWDEGGGNIIKQKFILNLQLKLGDDIMIRIANIKKPIEYKISIKFTDIKPTKKRLEQNIEKNNIESIFYTKLN